MKAAEQSTIPLIFTRSTMAGACAMAANSRSTPVSPIGLGGIVGSNLDIAVSDSISLEGDFCYIIADKVSGFEAIPGESANLSFSLVWHPGCHARDTFDSEYRPMFNVADNSSFIVNRSTLP